MARGKFWLDHLETDAALPPLARWLFSSSWNSSRTSLAIVLNFLIQMLPLTTRSLLQPQALERCRCLCPRDLLFIGRLTVQTKRAGQYRWAVVGAGRGTVVSPKSRTPHQRKQTRGRGAAAGRGSAPFTVTTREDGQMMRRSFK